MNARGFSAYLINLDSSPERLQAARMQLDREGIAFARISGVDGRALLSEAVVEYDRQMTIREFGRELHPGEIGCALSHLKALGEFVQSGNDYAVIFEDDLVLSEGFAQTISSVVACLNGLNAAVVTLGAMPRFAYTPLRKFEHNTLVRAHYFPTNAVALLWTRQGAIDYLAENPTIMGPNDIQLQSWLGSSGRGLALLTPMARQAGGASDIDSAGSAGRHKVPRPLSYRLRNYRRKIRVKAASLISFYRHRGKHHLDQP